jgi:hypothetical protein
VLDRAGDRGGGGWGSGRGGAGLGAVENRVATGAVLECGRWRMG